jgi:hypothetical protein
MKKRKFAGIIVLLLFFLSSTKAQYINPGIVLTFDDNSVANWHKLLPFFEKYNARATFFITKPYALNVAQQQMLVELYKAGNEIASHGFHHYNAVNFLDTSNLDQYIKQEILPSIHWFDSVLHIQVQTFAYPYGARNQQLDAKLLEYFSLIRGTSYQIFSSLNKITRLTHTGLVFGVGIDKSYGHSLSSVQQALLSCHEDSCIQVFYSHTPVDSVLKNYQISYITLDSMLAFAHKNQLAFYTLNETRLPTPEIPKGDTLIIQPQSSSFYQTTSSAFSYCWSISPPEAGYLDAFNQEASVFWNESFSGLAELSVAHTNSCGQGDFSNSLKIKVKYPVAVSETVDALMLYPNPCRGNFTVNLIGVNCNQVVEIYDMRGRLQQKREAVEKETAFEITDKGIYLVRISTAEKSISKVLVVE